MKKLFYNQLGKKSDDPSQSVYMSLWYGCLYVVVEGWRDLGLEDENVDQLLKSKNVNLLKGYRNDTFHFQEQYLPDRSMEFISSDDNPVEWVTRLHEAFSKYFLNWFKTR